MGNSQIRSGVLLSYVQQFLSIAVGLFYTPVMIRLLGQNEYGLYSSAASAVSMLGILQLGLGSSYIRFRARYRGRDGGAQRLNGLYLCVLSAVALVAVLCGGVLATHLELLFDQGLTAPEYVRARQLVGFLVAQLAISFPMNLFSDIIRVHERFAFAKLMGIFRTLLSPLVTLPFLLLGHGSVAMVAVSLTVTALSDAVSIYYVCAVLKEKFTFGKPDWQTLGEIFSHTGFIALHMLADRINWNVDKLLLGRCLGTRAVAVYAVGYALYEHYLTLGLPVSSVYIPRIHRIAAEEPQSRQLTELFVRIGKQQGILLMGICLGFFLFGREFLRLWVGDGYEDAYWVCLLLMVPGMVDIMQNIGVEVQRAQNRHRFRAAASLVMALMNFAISLPLCRRFGAVGCAAGTAVSILSIQGLGMNLHYRYRCGLDVALFWKRILPLAGVAAVTGLLGLAVKAKILIATWGALLACVAVFCPVYAAGVWLFGLNKEEKAAVRQAVAHRKKEKQYGN